MSSYVFLNCLLPFLDKGGGCWKGFDWDKRQSYLHLQVFQLPDNYMGELNEKDCLPLLRIRYVEREIEDVRKGLHSAVV